MTTRISMSDEIVLLEHQICNKSVTILQVVENSYWPGKQAPLVKPLILRCIDKYTSSFAHSATSPSFAYFSSPAPSVASPLLHPDRVHLSTAAPQSRPPQLLLTDCICLSCCSPIASASAAAPRSHLPQLLLPDCVHLSCCSLIVSASTAAP